MILNIKESGITEPKKKRIRCCEIHDLAMLLPLNEMDNTDYEVTNLLKLKIFLNIIKKNKTNMTLPK